MRTRIIVALIFAPVLLVMLLVLPPVFTAILVAGIAATASYELLRAVGAASRKGMCVSTAVSACLIPVCYWQGVESWGVRAVLLSLMCVLFFMAILGYGRENAITAESILFCLFGGVVIPSCLSALIQLRVMENGRLLVMLPVVVTWLTDVGAYFVGMFFGKHRGVTQVSPKKSVEGFFGGLLAGMIFMLGYALVLKNACSMDVSLLHMAVYGLVGSLVTELGDLAFSLIKRQFGVKDYGTLLPGHGGMLDRFDSMIFTAPTMWVLVTVFPAL